MINTQTNDLHFIFYCGIIFNTMNDYIPMEVFLKTADVKGPDECWLWKGPVDAELGYGRTSFLGYPTTAHRVAWELQNGDIPKVIGTRKALIRHLCNNRLCVNPNHLKLGTHTDNAVDISNASIDGVYVKLTLEMFKEVIELKKAGENTFRIARKMGVSTTTIINALKGKGYCYKRLAKIVNSDVQ
jgi:hypothetical protein